MYMYEDVYKHKCRQTLAVISFTIILEGQELPALLNLLCLAYYWAFWDDDYLSSALDYFMQIL